MSKSNNCGTLKLLKGSPSFLVRRFRKQAEETRSLERDFLIPAEQGHKVFSQRRKNHEKILAIAAVAALTAGVSAYAANPFSDVSTDDWAYQAVSDLSDQGVVEGYPDGTFKGERNMTRYELAQVIARLMARRPAECRTESNPGQTGRGIRR